MKTLIRAVAIVAIMAAGGCQTYDGLWDKSQVRNAALQRVGLEQIAWNAHDRSAIPAGMESLMSLKRMSAHVDRVTLEGTAASAVTSYRYDGTFSTPEGEKTGRLKCSGACSSRKTTTGSGCSPHRRSRLLVTLRGRPRRSWRYFLSFAFFRSEIWPV